MSPSSDTVRLMRPISQEEAERMRATLKTISSFLNPAREMDGGQAAARLARETLDELGLFFEDGKLESARRSS
jgi:hypothetical protein